MEQEVLDWYRYDKLLLELHYMKMKMADQFKLWYLKRESNHTNFNYFHWCVYYQVWFVLTMTMLTQVPDTWEGNKRFSRFKWCLKVRLEQLLWVIKYFGVGGCTGTNRRLNREVCMWSIRRAQNPYRGPGAPDF